MQMSSNEDILRKALLAIAYTRAGRNRSNKPCIIEGHRYYGETLRLMQQMLYDPMLSHSDEVLAAARCMCLYESFESTTGTMASWINQNRGIARMLEVRGPRNCREPFPRAVLESVRQNMMIVGIITRTPCFLEQEDWRTQPWIGISPKPLDQQLYDYGFVLATVYQEGGAISADQPASWRVYVDIFTKVHDAYQALSQLNEEVSKIHDGTDHLLSTPLPVVKALLLALDLCFSLFANALLPTCTPEIVESHREVIGQLLGYAQDSRRQQLARKIIQHLSSCLRTEPVFVMTMMLFPLNCARFELKDNEGDKDRVNSLMSALETGRGHRITGSVRRAGQSLAPPIARSSMFSQQTTADG
ncbi:uncharacterized protein HMPREF1541_07076 [Cyphellophora europaea CBS 101466]|uniref:Transcription factor domain-containing protein n=1 Tax=Cyphellophora europaea (strain CBS 101466) TaxID=1220924 RepID=W2RTK0_CYPE1|nr:uncharacterized protein HMPREF1541_07076 [Cyphellophora europaea CBS 101466]ETN39034.1 hypothetical protein HMPREF1541_07076 [Cyphellophora europaea CBS 101466]